MFLSWFERLRGRWGLLGSWFDVCSERSSRVGVLDSISFRAIFLALSLRNIRAFSNEKFPIEV